MGRTIVVGDVHGCARELATLLDRLSLTGDDDLIFVGDLVVRGPEPQRVLSIVRKAGGRAVKGNHEHRLLRWRQLRKHHREKAVAPQDQRLLSSKSLKETADQLKRSDWAMLKAMPLWLEVPQHELLVVHAGVVPNVALKKQEAHWLMYLRSIGDDGRPNALRDGGTPWGAVYSGPPHVVFGHNAQSSPQLYPWATGIDTGCVYGGKLSALVLESGTRLPAPAERAECIVSVPAEETYVPIR